MTDQQTNAEYIAMIQDLDDSGAAEDVSYSNLWLPDPGQCVLLCKSRSTKPGKDRDGNTRIEVVHTYEVLSCQGEGEGRELVDRFYFPPKGRRRDDPSKNHIAFDSFMKCASAFAGRELRSAVEAEEALTEAFSNNVSVECNVTLSSRNNKKYLNYNQVVA